MKALNLPLHGRRGYELLIAVGNHFQSVLLLGIRLYWGYSFYHTGLGKLQHLQRTTAYFTDLGIPAPGLNAAMAGTTECVGGIWLLLGLASRLTTIPLIVTMIVAYITADLPAVKGIFSDPGSFTSAEPFLFLLAALIVFAFGPGKFSLDYLIGRKFAKPQAEE